MTSACCPNVMEPRSLQRAVFRCPLCGSHTFAAVEITLRNGVRFTADFYHCTECSLHFVHPDRFMRAIDKASAPERKRSATLA
jgi:predicted RNA-binding Zn-ribbon protein involved in translation (DUF1610 family)